MTVRLALAAPALLAATLLLAGCAAEPEPEPTTEPPAAVPTTTPEPVGEPGFRLPTNCLTMLTDDRLASFDEGGLELLGGPGGRYGHDYLIDDTPEEEAGGITCIWGDEDVPSSTVTISVAPLDEATRPAVIGDLLAQGLNEGELDGATSFAQLGDEISSPAVLNVVRDDSWISIIEALGGEAFFEEAVEIAAEVAEQVYRAV